jgi:hypothetical protein
MKKTSNTRNERLFSAELKEVVKRLKYKEPELESVVDPAHQQEGHREETDTNLETDPHD